MNPQLKSIDAFTVIGYQLKANLQEIEEQQLGKKTLHRLLENQSLVQKRVGEEIYLIQLYDMKPNFNPNVDRFTQVIGYKVAEPKDVPAEMIVHTVPSHQYVMATHRGLEAELYKTYDALYGTWMGKQPYQPAGYDFEVWDERYKPDEATNEIDVYVAIR
ncbi:GyrI-like domain-containing protein [Halalkalibacterium halodurans]|uniref:GyrI-like domain-containing protein n=1 Tax=Halalkalibacterium halodurans TaxID=86665 RepID=UPI00106737C8|nr:GyrI-like domain-containing protein [Halalkalibacterium halodurans]MED3647180.1 GyrI-like domain-containing protein [Halalkalibacterium halodurans]TES53238.1 AraC family transcriptional regulator [Halalkalibacterium halodurans]